MGVKTRMKDFLNRFYSLKKAPRELWFVYLLKFLESYAYFSMSMNFVLFLSEEFQYSDVGAGTLYGVWGVLISVYGLLTGLLIDKMGVKMSLVLGGILSLIGRGIFSLAPNKWLMVSSVVLFMPVGFSLGIPVLTIAIKRYTVEENRTVAYGLFYSFMNISAVFSGIVTDSLVYFFKDGITINDWNFSALRLIFVTGMATNLIYILISIIFIREIDVNLLGEAKKVKPAQRKFKDSVKSVVKDSIFYKLMLFSAILVGARSIFRYLDASFPTYIKRELGPDTRYGTLYSINPFMVIFLVPLFSGVLAKFDLYKTITVGSFISAISVFVLCIKSAFWTSVLFVVILSIGESIYSPRVYEYTLLLAPKGQEGVYSTLSTAPMFVTKLLVGLLSGVLLDRFCPAEGYRNCELMWAIIGIISVTSPIFLIVFYKYIHTQDVRRRINDADRSKSDALIFDGDVATVPKRRVVSVEELIDEFCDDDNDELDSISENTEPEHVKETKENAVFTITGEDDNSDDEKYFV